MATRNRILTALIVCGASALLTQPAHAAPQPVQTEIGTIIHGKLEAGDSRLSAGQYADAYTFAGTAGEEILFNLASSDFDGFLWLLDSAGEVIAIDDNSGEAANALISKVTLPKTDRYTIHASSYNDKLGDYTLSLNDAPAIDTVEQLALGEQVKGELTADDDQFDTGQNFDAYSFPAKSGQAVALTVRSKDFDTYLWLLNAEGRVVTVNDGQAGGSKVAFLNHLPLVIKGRAASQILFFPPVTGTYTVLAGSRDADAEGKYSLDIKVVAMPDKVGIGSISDGISGELTNSDYQLSIGQYVDVYTFRGKQGESVTMALDSSNLDSYLRILDSYCNVIQTDDDSGGGANSLIEKLLLPKTGDYYVWVSSFFIGQKGNYTLHFNDLLFFSEYSTGLKPVASIDS